MMLCIYMMGMMSSCVYDGGVCLCFLQYTYQAAAFRILCRLCHVYMRYNIRQHGQQCLHGFPISVCVYTIQGLSVNLWEGAGLVGLVLLCVVRACVLVCGVFVCFVGFCVLLGVVCVVGGLLGCCVGCPYLGIDFVF